MILRQILLINLTCHWCIIEISKIVMDWFTRKHISVSLLKTNKKCMKTLLRCQETMTRPTLKSCLLNKKIFMSHLRINLFLLQSLCLKRYMTKISSWYSKNVTLCIFISNFHVQFFMMILQNLIMMTEVNQNTVPTQIKQTNLSILSLIFGLIVSFADPLWFTMYRDCGL